MCKFCEDFREVRETTQEQIREFNEDPTKAFYLKPEYRVVLIEKTLRLFKETREKNHAGTWQVGTYKLRYCPECGRYLQGKKRRGKR